MRLALKHNRSEALEGWNFTPFFHFTKMIELAKTPISVLHYKDLCSILDLIRNLPLLFEIQLMLFELCIFALLALLGSLFTTKLIF